jgi:hypothetical protein
MNSFWEWFWIAFLTFAFVAYLFAMFTIIVDLFRDKTVYGWMKAVWFIFLILFPVLTALVYLIARGGGMAERQMKDAQAVKEAQDSYIRDVAGSSPADQIAKAKELHNSGAITDEEYEALKAKALS